MSESKTVAIVGASSNRNKFGNKALRAFERRGYTVIPINPNEAEVEGHKTFATVLDVPNGIDTVPAGPAVESLVAPDLKVGPTRPA